MISLPKFILAEAQRAEAFAELVKNAERLNSLDQAEAEAKARLDKLTAERLAAEADVASCKRAAALVCAAGDDHYAAANVKAADIVAKAEQVAKARIAEADAKADAVLAYTRECEAVAEEAKKRADSSLAAARAADAELAAAREVIVRAEAIKRAMG